jgi:hypothetical protein
VIAKAIPGRQVGGLIRYLYGPGKDQVNNPHENPRVVGGWAPTETLEPPVRVAAGGAEVRDFRPLVNALEAPVLALHAAPDQPVYHVPIRMHAEDRNLSDQEWGRIAQGAVDKLGMGGPGGCRWVAIRHGNEHVHLVVTLGREDGRRQDMFRDRIKLREYCRATEDRLGLTPTGKADRTANPAPTKAEMQKAVRTAKASRADQRAVPATISAELRRRVQAAAASSSSTEQFFDRLRAGGVEVGLRMSTKNEGQVTGYKVRLPGYHGKDDPGVWFSGGKLAPDLSLPKIEARWSTPAPLRPAVGPGQRAAALNGVTEVTRVALVQIADPAMPRSAAELLRVTAQGMEPGKRGPLTAAADRFDRAYREPGSRPQAAGPHAAELRGAAMTLSTLGMISGGRDRVPVVQLLVALTALLEATADLRRTQQRVQQAQAARQAAETLKAETTRLRGLDSPAAAAARMVPGRAATPTRAPGRDQDLGR